MAAARPRTTNAEIVDMLNKEINASLADPEMKARLTDLGGRVLGGSPANFGKPQVGVMSASLGKYSRDCRCAA